MAKNVTKTELTKAEVTATAAILAPLRTRLDSWEADRQGMIMQNKIDLDTRLIDILTKRAHAVLDTWAAE